MATRSRRAPEPSGGIPAYVPAIGVLLVAAAAAIWILSQVERSSDDDEEPVEQVDPFAGLEEEAPPGTTGGARPTRAGSASGGSNPFADVPSARKDPVWLAAVELAERGQALADESAAAKAAGDFDGFKEKGAEAKELLSQACDDTQAFEEELGKQLGYDHPDVKAVVRARSRWLKTLVALKKTVGF